MVNTNKKKKIIFFANTLWFLWNFKYELAKEFIGNGFCVEFVYLKENYLSNCEKKEVTEKLNLSEIKVSKLKNYKLNTNFYNILLSYTIKCILYSPLFFYKCNLKIANYDGLGRIFSSRSICERIARRFFEKAYLILHNFFFDHTIVLNSSDLIYFLNKGINIPSNISILPGTGINKNFFKFNPKYEIDVNKQYITMISRLNNLKGINDFLALVYIYNLIFKDIIPDQLIKFRVVVPSKDIRKINKLINKNEIIKKCLLIVPYSLDVRKIYDTSLCIVHPTVYGEGLPRIYLEAAACGVPVITTKNPGYVDFYENYKTALIVEKNNPKQILDKIKDLIIDSSLRRTLIDNSKDNLDKYFSNTNKQYILIINKLFAI
ncbi:MULTISPECIES: glycosyltransferase [Prochlorococcus]|uniref:Glycosyl transferase group 1 n=1 Tax=Prochlorococcus marinus str. MIT 9116 TaxID=167544 RepID=A0A0A1ZY52_PROMR|nr:glycosyltransferase [Prochlorococcus marinus]KGF91981.1 Glycosyl transferase group 1 [Prochlorococcus marinus str. MIT 9107]KGF93068.1 Glycosyl transferase group 1 [Prochlorococcus marinus str. MIT 9116]KGF93974.1 Glycosyl transferase group 1 [Prochlorococcus marinus str. MIT 9123]